MECELRSPSLEGGGIRAEVGAQAHTARAARAALLGLFCALSAPPVLAPGGSGRAQKNRPLGGAGGVRFLSIIGAVRKRRDSNPRYP